MKILFVASEGAPFIKTGGLADVIGALPKALSETHTEVAIVLPYYKRIKDNFEAEYVGYTYVNVGHKSEYVGIFKRLHQGIPYYFIDNNHYFYREGNIYGYDDDGERYTFFNLAVLEALKIMDFSPDVLHVHDWQAGLIPYLLKAKYHFLPKYQHIKTVFTIHNIQYQGDFPMDMHHLFNLPYSSAYEQFGKVNFMKAAIHEADLITTVSPSYKDELLTSYYGYGLDGLLAYRIQDLYGIINGIDTDDFDPQTDKHLSKNYHKNAFIQGKKANKRDIQETLYLPTTDVPVIGFVSRLAEQKGIDLLKGILEETIHSTNAQYVLMGSGEKDYEHFFAYLQSKYPNRVGIYIGYNEAFAQKIYAGSDMFLMPSKFEPCGLSQLIAMRYGSIPIVRETGGLKDTVIPYNPIEKTGTGFGFMHYNAHELKDAIEHAVYVYNTDTQAWKDMVKRAMAQDFSWNQSAKAYLALYEKVKQ